MYAQDDDGGDLDAEYVVERDGDGLALVLSSASGAAANRSARNTDYRRALEVFLGRLGDLDAVLTDALVDSAETRRRGLPERERRLIDGPVRLAEKPDLDRLRRDLTNRQGRVGKAPGATRDGNTTKRIRLRVAVPGFGADDGRRLGSVLSQPTSGVAFPHDPAELAARSEFDLQSEDDTPDTDYDERRRVLGQIVARQGQSRFRNALIRAYGGRCAVTGCPVVAVLEAAHLHPYRGMRTNSVQNGLLLRADIHTMLDLRLLAPDPDTRTIVLSKQLAGSEYDEFAGRQVTEPAPRSLRPTTQTLEAVWAKFLQTEKER